MKIATQQSLLAFTAALLLAPLAALHATDAPKSGGTNKPTQAVFEFLDKLVKRK